MAKLTLEQFAKHLDGVWHGSANHAIFGFPFLSQATAHDVTYFDNLLFQHVLNATALRGQN